MDMIDPGGYVRSFIDYVIDFLNLFGSGIDIKTGNEAEAKTRQLNQDRQINLQRLGKDSSGNSMSNSNNQTSSITYNTNDIRIEDSATGDKFRDDFVTGKSLA
jgi:hypothetical protein